jgi:hypothetical protein
MRFSRATRHTAKELPKQAPEPRARLEPAEERLLSGILAQAEVDDVGAVEQMLWRAQVKGSDLVAGTECQNEVLLEQAGLPVGDRLKVLRVLRTLHAEPPPPSRGGPSPSRAVFGVQRFAPSMKCGLIVYSTTILVVTLCMLSFYLPAVVYQVRNVSRRGAALRQVGAGVSRYGLGPAAAGAGGAGAANSFQPLLQGSTVSPAE